jgi:hypothetical protein
LGPGPAAYNVNEKKHLSGAKMGKDEKKAGDHVLTSPGPGAYNIDSKSTLGTIIGRGCRDRISQDPTPGPGNYDPPK